MVSKECNLRAGVYKVQTFGTLQEAGRNINQCPGPSFTARLSKTWAVFPKEPYTRRRETDAAQ